MSEHLQLQGSEVQKNHQSIVNDLTDVRHQAQDIYQKIGKKLDGKGFLKGAGLIKCVLLRADGSMLEFLQYQDQTSQYYSELMDKLERMNSTLGSMLHYMDHMQARLEERLHVIQGYLGWAGEAWSRHVSLLTRHTLNQVLTSLGRLAASIFPTCS